jgi:hypothetical protein
VKKEPGTPSSFTRVKKEPISFTRVKKDHGTPVPPPSKKARPLADEAAGQLDYQAPRRPGGVPRPEGGGGRDLQRGPAGDLGIRPCARREEGQCRARAPPRPLRQPRRR